MAFKRLSFFTASNYLTLFLSFMQSVLLAKILSQYYMGYFSQVRLFLSYLLLLNAGAMNGLLTMLPNADSIQKRKLKNISFSLVFIQFAFVAAVCIAMYLWSGNMLFSFLAVMILPFVCREALSFAFRGEGRFKEAGIFNITGAVISFVTVTVFALFWSLKGAIAGMIISILLSLALGVVLSGGILPAWSFKIVKKLHREGARIYFNGILNLFSDSLERVLLAFIISKETFAVYAVSIAMVSVFDMLPSSIGQYMLPDFVGNRNRWGSSMVKKLIGFNVNIMTVLIIFSSVLYYFLIKYFLPLYAKSMVLFSILAVSSLFSIVYYVLYNKMVSAKTMRVMYYSQIIVVFLKVVILALYFKSADSVNLVVIAFMMVGMKILYALILGVMARIFGEVNIFSYETFLDFSLGFAAVCSSMYLLRISPLFAVFIGVFYVLIYAGRFLRWKRELI